MQREDPLVAFSRYLAGRNTVLLAIADEIRGHLDHGVRTRASDLTWLWTLGAYEVARTMSQAPRCFAPAFFARITSLKADLERVRVPNTKMERIKYDRKAPSIPVASDREPDRWDEAARDLWVGDPNDEISSRALFARYADVMQALTPADVLMSHEESFA